MALTRSELELRRRKQEREDEANRKLREERAQGRPTTTPPTGAQRNTTAGRKPVPQGPIKVGIDHVQPQNAGDSQPTRQQRTNRAGTGAAQPGNHLGKPTGWGGAEFGAWMGAARKAEIDGASVGEIEALLHGEQYARNYLEHSDISEQFIDLGGKSLFSLMSGDLDKVASALRSRQAEMRKYGAWTHADYERAKKLDAVDVKKLDEDIGALRDAQPKIDQLRREREGLEAQLGFSYDDVMGDQGLLEYVRNDPAKASAFAELERNTKEIADTERLISATTVGAMDPAQLEAMRKQLIVYGIPQRDLTDPKVMNDEIFSIKRRKKSAQRVQYDLLPQTAEDYEEKAAAGQAVPGNKAESALQYKDKWRQATDVLHNLGNVFRLQEINDQIAYSYMTDDERKNYNYLLGPNGEGLEEAEAYAYLLLGDLRTRREDDWTREVPGLRSRVVMEQQPLEGGGMGRVPVVKPGIPLIQAMYGFRVGVKNAAEGIEQAFSADIVPDSGVGPIWNEVYSDLGKQGAKMPDWLGDRTTWQFAGNLAHTTGNMLPSIVANAIVPGIGPIVIGLGAGGNAYKAGVEQYGMTQSEAGTYALLVGGSEALLEKALGMGQTGGGWIAKQLGAKTSDAITNGVLSAAKHILGNAFSEASEEYLQEVLEPIFVKLATDQSINWEDFDWTSSDAVYAAIMGAAMGGGGEITTQVFSAFDKASMGKSIQSGEVDMSVSELVDTGLGKQQDSPAYKLALGAQTEIDAGGTPSSLTLSDLFYVGASAVDAYINPTRQASQESTVDLDEQAAIEAARAEEARIQALVEGDIGEAGADTGAPDMYSDRGEAGAETALPYEALVPDVNAMRRSRADAGLSDVYTDRGEAGADTWMPGDVREGIDADPARALADEMATEQMAEAAFVGEAAGAQAAGRALDGVADIDVVRRAAESMAAEQAAARSAQLDRQAGDLNAGARSAYAAGYSGQTSPEVYDQAFRAVYEAAREGLSYEQISRSAPYYMEQLGERGGYLAFAQGEAEYRATGAASQSADAPKREPRVVGMNQAYGADTQYLIKSRSLIEAEDIDANIAAVAEMGSVSTLAGDEFPKGEKGLVEQVAEYYETLGNSVSHPVLGDVDIDKRGIRDSAAHGIGRVKAMAFKAVPDIIAHGKVVDFQVNWKGRGYDTVVLAAPMKIAAGDYAGDYYAAVIVQRTLHGRQGFYLHELLTTKRRTDAPFKTGAVGADGTSGDAQYPSRGRTDAPFKTGPVGADAAPGDAQYPSLLSLLEKVRDVKANSQAAMDAAVQPGAASQSADAPRHGSRVVGLNREYSSNVKLTRQQETELRVLDALGKKFGLTIAAVDRVAGGAANGSYNRVTGEIEIALDALGRAYMYVGVHEMVHHLQDWNPDEYAAMRDYVLDMLSGKDGYDLEARIEQFMEAQEGMTREQAIDEIVADAVPAFLSDEANVKALIETNRTLAEKIRDFIGEFVAEIRRVLGRLGKQAGRHEIEVLSKDAEALSAIYDMFTAALEGARGNKEAWVEVQAKNGLRYSINPEFARDYDAWNQGQGSPSVQFTIGTTSDVLKSIGVKDGTIQLSGAKIQKIKIKHPAMTDDVIKQIPNILENPVIVMQSRTVGHRVTMFGEVYDANGIPVLAVLDLTPTNEKGLALDSLRVSSAYGKDSKTQEFIDNSRILYVNPDIETTQNWLEHTRLQLPVRTDQFGVISNIAYDEAGVKITDQRYSIKHLGDGTPYVDVDVNQSLFDGLNPAEMQMMAKMVILERFKGKVIGDGESRAYVKGDGAGEYAYPAKFLKGELLEAKMRASTELDNLLSVSQHIGHEADDGRHEKATGGWDKYRTVFKVGKDVWSGEAAIMNTARGRVFYDVTKIKGVTDSTLGQMIINDHAESISNPSDHIIRKPGPEVNAEDLRLSMKDLGDADVEAGALPEGHGYNARYHDGLLDIASELPERMSIEDAKQSFPKDLAGESNIDRWLHGLEKRARKGGEPTVSREDIADFIEREREADRAGMPGRIAFTNELMGMGSVEVLKSAAAPIRKQLGEKSSVWLDRIKKEILGDKASLTVRRTDGAIVSINKKTIEETFAQNNDERSRELALDVLPNVKNLLKSAVYTGSHYDYSFGASPEVDSDRRRIHYYLAAQQTDKGLARVLLHVKTSQADPRRADVGVKNALYLERAEIISAPAGTPQRLDADASRIVWDSPGSSTDTTISIRSLLSGINLNKMKFFDGPPTGALGLRFSMKNLGDAHAGQRLSGDAGVIDSVELLAKLAQKSRAAAVRMAPGAAASAAEQSADALLKRFRSGYDRDDLADNLGLLYAHLARVSDWPDVVAVASDLGKAVVEKSRNVDDYLYRQYADVREALRETPLTLTGAQRLAVERAYGSFHDFRKANFGRLNLSEGGMGLNRWWRALSQSNPELFDEDTREEDQPGALVEALEAIRPAYINLYGMDMDAAALDAGLQMIVDFYDAAIRGGAGKGQVEAERARYAMKQRLNEMRRQYKAEYEMRGQEIAREGVRRRQALASRYRAATTAVQRQAIGAQMRRLDERKSAALDRQRAYYQQMRARRDQAG